MANPLIRSNGTNSGLGTGGLSRKDLVRGETVSLEDTEGANSGGSYSWEILDAPIDSAGALTGANTANPSFVADGIGSWRIRCTVNGEDTAVVILAVATPNAGVRLPAYLEEPGEYNGEGNAESWNEAQARGVIALDAALGGGGDAPSTIIIPLIAQVQVKSGGNWASWGQSFGYNEKSWVAEFGSKDADPSGNGRGSPMLPAGAVVKAASIAYSGSQTTLIVRADVFDSDLAITKDSGAGANKIIGDQTLEEITSLSEDYRSDLIVAPHTCVNESFLKFYFKTVTTPPGILYNTISVNVEVEIPAVV